MSRDERLRRFLDECCDALGIQLHELLEQRRDRASILDARKAIAWAMREKFAADASFPVLGRLMQRDHTTVLVGVKKFRKALEKEAPWALELRMTLTGIGDGVAGIELPGDSLRSCGGIDMTTAIDMPAKALS